MVGAEAEFRTSPRWLRNYHRIKRVIPSLSPYIHSQRAWKVFGVFGYMCEGKGLSLAVSNI